MQPWQTERARTRQPHLEKLVVLPGTPCAACGHFRSSHSLLVLTAPCKLRSCPCAVFDPLCGCGHLLCEHSWGTPPTPWACSRCVCRGFGAQIEPEQLRFANDK